MGLPPSVLSLRIYPPPWIQTITGAPLAWNVAFDTQTSRNKQSSLSLGPGGAFASVALFQSGEACGQIQPQLPSWTPADRLSGGG